MQILLLLPRGISESRAKVVCVCERVREGCSLAGAHQTETKQAAGERAEEDVPGLSRLFFTLPPSRER